MIICVCKGISHTDIQALVKESGNEVQQVQSACGAGSDCGSCVEKLKKFLETVNHTSAHSSTAG